MSCAARASFAYYGRAAEKQERRTFGARKSFESLHLRSLAGTEKCHFVIRGDFAPSIRLTVQTASDLDTLETPDALLVEGIPGIDTTYCSR